MSIKTELMALKAEHGELLKGETIHDWARDNPESDTHGQLEWDDTKGGYQWRLQQIRCLVRLYVVDENTGERQLVSLKIDRAQPGGGYRDIATVKADPSLRRMLLDEALSELRRVERKYSSLVKELSPVWQAVTAVEQQQQEEVRTSAA